MNDFLRFQKTLKKDDLIYNNSNNSLLLSECLKFIGFVDCKFRSTNMTTISCKYCKGLYTFECLSNGKLYNQCGDYFGNSIFSKFEEFIKEEEFSI